MKKMTLDLDSLAVESFDTSAGVAGRGTVRGHDTVVEPVQSQKNTQCLCPVTSICIVTDDDASCGQTLCNQNTCACPGPTEVGPSCDQISCYLTQCLNTCARCDSFTGQITC